MRPIVKYTLKQTVFLNVLFIILMIVGVFSLLTTPTENMPLVDIGKVFITTVYYGAPADDVEQLVTRKVEQALESLEDVEYIQSNSHRNFSTVQVKFIDDSDYRGLYNELRFRILNIKDELPLGADDPKFFWFDTNIWKPVIVVHVSGDLPPRSLERYAEDLQAHLQNIPNVRDVEIQGDYEDEFHVSLNPDKLRRFGVTFSQVTQAVEAANTKIPTGRFRTGDTALMLDAGQRLKSQNDVLDIIVRRDGDGNFIRVRDLVTTARLHHRDPIDISSVNGKSSINLVITKEQNGDAVTISDAVKDRARRFGQKHASEGIGVVFTNDSTIEINDSVNTLNGNLILGMTLVTAVLWWTLGFRNAMLTAVGIPFSFLCTLIIMRLAGMTINTISLFSFVLVTGIIVDDAVIIVENCFRHLQMGKPKRQAIIDGTSEVMLPIVSSALTTILAFIPMLIMTGSTGDFFAIIPKTVTYALIASLLEALFILPIHIFDWGPKATDAVRMNGAGEDPFAHLQKGIFSWLWLVYRKVTVWLLDHKFVTFAGITVTFIAALSILLLSILGITPLIKVKFFPGNYFRYHVTLQAEADTSLERTDSMVRDLSRFIMSLGTRQAQSAAGYTGYFEDQDYVRYRGSNYGQIIVTLPEAKERDFPENPSNDPMQHLVFMREHLKAYVDRTYATEPKPPRIQVFEEGDGPPTGKAVNIRIQADTMHAALAFSDKLMTYMSAAPELADLVDLNDNRPEIFQTVKFLPKPEAAYEYNLSTAQITALVAGVLNGRYVGPFRTEDDELDMVVRIARTDDPANAGGPGLKSPLDVLSIPVIEDSAAPIYLRDLATARYSREPNVRSRYQGKPTITVTADIQPGSKLSAASVQNLVRDYFQTQSAAMPGVAISFGGEFESTTKSYISLLFAFIIALMGMYIVLSSQFRDYLQPLLILTAVPFALIGVSFGLFFSHTIFTIGSFIATVGLSGVAVNNTILLIDFMNKNTRQGKPLRQAVLESCAARMRPVMITTITTILGLMPMAIGFPNKSISWAPMAIAFVTGLASSTVLALLITPANYEFLESLRLRVKQRRFRLLLRRQRRKHEAN